MIWKSISRAAVLLFGIAAIVPRVTSTLLPEDIEKHRPSWPAWFHNRDKSSPSERHGRHESQRSRPAGARIPHDTFFRNSINRYEAEIRDLRRNFINESSFSSSGHAGLDASSSSSHLRGSNAGGDETIESRTARPTSTTKTNGASEKVTALAVGKYSGTRAVAYVGYHRHNFDYNPTRTHEILETRHGLLSTPETPIYNKHHAGRRVCTRQTPNSIAHHHHSRQYSLIYTESSSSTFVCCPGWSQVSRTSYGCNRPSCAAICLNGGVCGPHGKCNCPKGYMGTQCQTDVDECISEKPCGQICLNTPGSYKCHCRNGFHLQPDGQSCRKNGSDGTAFEARDLENDYGYTTSTTTVTPRRTTSASRDAENEVGEGNVDQDYEIILKRLGKLEKQIARGKKRESEVSELNTKITQAVEGVAAMRRAVDNVQLMQQEIFDMKGKVKQFELETRKLQHLMNRMTDLENRLKLRCRTSING